MFTVKIVKLKVRTKIGVSVQERKKHQLLLVSLKFSYKINHNKNLDTINNLISYTNIKSRVSIHQMIEELKGRI